MSKYLADTSKAAHHGMTTALVHGDDFLHTVADVAAPIHVSSTFRYSDDPSKLVQAKDLQFEDVDSHIYSRYTTPNSTALEALLSYQLNGYALVYGSGLSAFHAALIHLSPKRLSIGDGYHGCHGVANIISRNYGMIQLPLDCPADDLQPGDVIHLETPINPTGEALDIKHYAEKAHSRGALLMVDATFAPPPLVEPFKFGADIVMHSATKYFGGHSDLLGGVLVTQDLDRRWEILNDRHYLGSIMGSLESWLSVRSVRTLELRVKRQSESATHLVEWLTSGDDKDVVDKVVAKVRHASLQKEAWVKEQMPNGFGPVFAIEMATEKQARTLPSLLSLFTHATSLGGVESLIEWRAISDEKVSPMLMRVSVGIEDWRDLKDDFKQAFVKLAEMK